MGQKEPKKRLQKKKTEKENRKGKLKKNKKMSKIKNKGKMNEKIDQKNALLISSYIPRQDS